MLSCPFLSTPARMVKGRKVPAANEPCRGAQCPVYRPHQQYCALIEVPETVDQVSALSTTIAEHNEDQIASLERVKDGIFELLREWSQDSSERLGEFAGESQKVLEASREQGEDLQRLLGEVGGLNRSLGSVTDMLRDALHRIDEKRRTREAEEATLQAIDLYRKRDYSRAIRGLVNAAGRLQNMPDIHATLGCVYIAEKQYENALRELRLSIHLDPERADAHVNLGAALYLTGETEEGEEALREGLRLDPNSGPGWNTLGNLLFSTGRRFEGIEAWLTAVARQPDLEPAWENLRRQQCLDNVPFEALREGVLTRDSGTA